MDFRMGQLRSFLVLAETLNYARAARILYMTQPTLSVQIKSLEDAFGARLFDRNRQGVTVTEAGRELAGVARAILDDLSAAAGRMRHLDLAAPLRVCCSQAGQVEIMPAVMQAMASSYPELSLEFLTMVPSERVNALQTRKVDLLMMVPPVYADGLDYEHLTSEAMIAILPDRAPYNTMRDISVHDFVKEPLLMVNERECAHCNQATLTALAEHGARPSRMIEAPIDTQSRMAFVSGGRAVTLGSLASLHLSFPGVVRLPFRETILGAPLGIAWRADDTSEPLRALMRELRVIAGRKPNRVAVAALPISHAAFADAG